MNGDRLDFSKKKNIMGYLAGIGVETVFILGLFGALCLVASLARLVAVSTVVSP